MTKKIYTKTGDKGMTGTFHGRLSKSDQLARTLGTIDELNSAIGLSRHATPLDKELRRIQKNLLTIGSSLAGSGVKISASETRNLEKLIDRLTLELPKLANFIFPKGRLHMARSICRRAEREVVALEVNDKNVLKYLNRLSDGLFTMGRWVCFKMGVEEEVWKV